MAVLWDWLDRVPPYDTHLLALVRTCISRPACARVLRWFAAHATTLIGIDDLAADLGLPPDSTQAAVRHLCEMGLLREVSAGGLTFYGLAEGPPAREVVRRFENWCQEQLQRVEAIHELVD